MYNGREHLSAGYRESRRHLGHAKKVPNAGSRGVTLAAYCISTVYLVLECSLMFYIILLRSYTIVYIAVLCRIRLAYRSQKKCESRCSSSPAEWRPDRLQSSQDRLMGFWITKDHNKSLPNIWSSCILASQAAYWNWNPHHSFNILRLLGPQIEGPQSTTSRHIYIMYIIIHHDTWYIYFYSPKHPANISCRINCCCPYRLHLLSFF